MGMREWHGVGGRSYKEWKWNKTEKIEEGERKRERVRREREKGENWKGDEGWGKKWQRLTFPTGYPCCSRAPYLRIDTQFPPSLAPIEGSLRQIAGAPFDFE